MAPLPPCPLGELAQRPDFLGSQEQSWERRLRSCHVRNANANKRHLSFLGSFWILLPSVACWRGRAITCPRSSATNRVANRFIGKITSGSSAAQLCPLPQAGGHRRLSAASSGRARTGPQARPRPRQRAARLVRVVPVLEESGEIAVRPGQGDPVPEGKRERSGAQEEKRVGRKVRNWWKGGLGRSHSPQGL